MRKYNFVKFLLLCATFVITIQIVYIEVNGASICPNKGCELVEQFTSLSPLYLNILGLLYFQFIYWLFYFFKNELSRIYDYLTLLFLAGLIFEGILLSYQIFVIQVICSYCIFIFLLIIILNIIYSYKQLLISIIVITSVVFAFSILTFLPPGSSSQFYSLENGSYGVKSCANPSKKIYLIFSSDCSHCIKIIEKLKNCNSCEVYFNPIDKIDIFKIDGLKLNDSYSQEVNHLILSILGIKKIPVLVVKELSGFSFIKGETNILNYIRSACFDQKPTRFYDQSENVETTITIEDSEECLIDINCED